MQPQASKIRRKDGALSETKRKEKMGRFLNKILREGAEPPPGTLPPRRIPARSGKEGAQREGSPPAVAKLPALWTFATEEMKKRNNMRS